MPATVSMALCMCADLILPYIFFFYYYFLLRDSRVTLNAKYWRMLEHQRRWTQRGGYEDQVCVSTWNATVAANYTHSHEHLRANQYKWIVWSARVDRTASDNGGWRWWRTWAQRHVATSSETSTTVLGVGRSSISLYSTVFYSHVERTR